MSNDWPTGAEAPCGRPSVDAAGRACGRGRREDFKRVARGVDAKGAINAATGAGTLAGLSWITVAGVARAIAECLVPSMAWPMGIMLPATASIVTAPNPTASDRIMALPLFLDPTYSFHFEEPSSLVFDA